jgi:hypothetical protein
MYKNFIKDSIDNNLLLDELMKEEIRFILSAYPIEKALEIMVYDLIPSLHHEANDLKREYILQKRKMQFGVMV